MIALDHRQAPARPHHAAQLGQDRRGIGKVLQHEADEGMIEARPREGQGPEIGLPQRRHGQAGGPDSRLRLRERGRGDVDAGEHRVGILPQERDRLGADAAARLQHRAAGGIAGAAMQPRFQRRRPVAQARLFRRRVAVNVVVVPSHPHPPGRGRSSPGAATGVLNAIAASGEGGAAAGRRDPVLADEGAGHVALVGAARLRRGRRRPGSGPDPAARRRRARRTRCWPR